MKVGVVYKDKRSWVNRDIELLKKHYDVEEYDYKNKKNHEIKNFVKNNDVIVNWFASLHSLNSTRYGKKFGKKIVTISGGYDISLLKGYGLPTSIKTRWIPKYILSRSDKIIAFSQFAKKEIHELIPNKEVQVSFGMDTEKFTPTTEKKKPVVLTVAYIDIVSWWRKGIDRFVSVAREYNKKGSDVIFKVVGKIDSSVQEKIDVFDEIENLYFVGFLSDEELLKEYRQAKIYAQFSRHEGFGCSVAEAMLCNCIPVVSRIGSLPEVVGENGVYVEDNEQFGNAIDKALSLNFDEQRKWIAENFSIKEHEKKLVESCK